MKTVPGPWMFWNARAVKAGCESLQRFIHRMRSEKFSTASACLAVLPQFRRLCPNPWFVSIRFEVRLRMLRRRNNSLVQRIRGR